MNKRVGVNVLKKEIENIEASLSLNNLENRNVPEVDNMQENIIEDTTEEEIIDCIYELEVSKDKMEAYINILPAKGGKEADLGDIFKEINSYGINYGLNNSTIENIINNKIYNKRILIAKGTAPINGKDAFLEYHFDISTKSKVSILEDGKVDFRELSLIKNVIEDELLLTMTPHTEGISGYNVYGDELPAKDGKKINLPKGKNVKETEDGLRLLSAIKGEVKIIDNKVHVLPVYEVPANVDNSTGNIRFFGRVVVKANVLTGFVIEADEDVEVYGVVEGAKIISGGNIILHRGMQGMNKGELHCEGDLIARFIENSTIFAKGNIESEAIMHSTIYCGKKLELKGRKGLLVGGEIRACEEIKAKVVGSPMATTTKIEVGTSPEIRAKYEKIKSEIEQTADNHRKLSQAVNLLTKLSRKTELAEDKKELLNKSIIMKLKTKDKLDKLKREVVELETYIEEISNGKVKVQEIVYPGTKITIGSSSLYIKDQVQNSTFYRFGGEIKIAPYK